MDLAPEELQFLKLPDILREAVAIPKHCPNTFYLITLTVIFPLSFASLAQPLFADSLLAHLQTYPKADPSQTSHETILLLLFQFFYLSFLSAFSLVSTAAVVYTVATLYSSKPVSFSSTMSAIPKVFKRLFVTFFCVSLLLLAYNFVLFTFLVIIATATSGNLLLFLSAVAVLLLFLVVDVYISALWQLASVVSVLEPVHGFAAVKKSRELLKGKTRYAFTLVFLILATCFVIGVVFGLVVVNGGNNYGVYVRIVVGGFLVCVVVIVNLVGLLVQSVFYYVCKSYHHQGIDKNVLHDHLGEYL
ncbi:uncharacterized protein LOC121266778 [Juglans microcarpa x Juglans regia]|uniref:uncharacterized protein LOC121266778 n=1 Tax=Juglans microcarpa x Juglans regia TaxID=2249226 RepID=UPI001B7DC146|nr:uncharacterized protein LOC121266778 [Juglans microcarpa x Juglans regia]